MEKRVAFCVLKALVAAYIVTGLLLLILAFALYKLGLSENVVELGVVFIYLLSSAIGGFFIGKCMEVKRFVLCGAPACVIFDRAWKCTGNHTIRVA